MKVAKTILNCFNCLSVVVKEYQAPEESPLISQLMVELVLAGLQVRGQRPHPNVGQAFIDLPYNPKNTKERILAVLQEQHDKGIITLE